MVTATRAQAESPYGMLWLLVVGQTPLLFAYALVVPAPVSTFSTSVI